jgi:hypothetical protein
MVEIKGSKVRKRRAASLGAVLLLAIAAAPAFAVPAWLAVPGAPELAIGMASIDVLGPAVRVSVRGGPRALVTPIAEGSTGPWHWTVARMEFNCSRRQMRTQGFVAYDSANHVVHSSTLRSDWRLVPGEGDLAAVYDASCELARALG